MPGDGERPRWSFTALLRIQRTGRNRPERAEDGQQQDHRRAGRWIFIAILGGIVIAEVVIGVWLGILPR